jgi:uncharacterized protein (DUF927 family)
MKTISPSQNGVTAARVKAEAAALPDEISQFEEREDGVYFVGDKNSVFKICGPLRVLAETQTKDGENYGRLLEWNDSKNRVHRWAMPIELVHSDSNEHIKYLVSRGLELLTGKKTREKLSLYLATTKPAATAISTNKVGWHQHVFVLPEDTIGKLDKNESIIFQSVNSVDHRFRIRGTLQEWQSNVARLCAGNSRLVFAVSTAFAACLLTPLVENGGGFHFRGPSSFGKSTALFAAGSVWGGEGPAGFTYQWRTTANGLEAIAELHNDSLLCLDELKQCDPKTAGELAYMLANGQGKGRMTKGISVRRSLAWNLLFLSSGELSLPDFIRQGGARSYGGQEVRMCDIPADAEKGFGLFENLHEFPTAELLAKRLHENSQNYYGTVIRSFLQFVSANLSSLKNQWVKFRSDFMKDIVPNNSTGEVHRVAARFALVAFGGYLAHEFCGWDKDEAKIASKLVFNAWIDSRGTNGQADAENAVRQVRAFLEAHGNSRFQDLEDETNKATKIYNQVGYIRKNPVTDETEYLISPTMFSQEICKDFDAKFVANQLAKRGFLELADGKTETLKIRQLTMTEMKKAARIENKPRDMFIVNSKIFEITE